MKFIALILLAAASCGAQSLEDGRYAAFTNKAAMTISPYLFAIQATNGVRLNDKANVLPLLTNPTVTVSVLTIGAMGPMGRGPFVLQTPSDRVAGYWALKLKTQ